MGRFGDHLATGICDGAKSDNFCLSDEGISRFNRRVVGIVLI
jgi:hypothetical protein